MNDTTSPYLLTLCFLTLCSIAVSIERMIYLSIDGFVEMWNWRNHKKVQKKPRNIAYIAEKLKNWNTRHSDSGSGSTLKSEVIKKREKRGMDPVGIILIGPWHSSLPWLIVIDDQDWWFKTQSKWEGFAFIASGRGCSPNTIHNTLPFWWKYRMYLSIVL